MLAAGDGEHQGRVTLNSFEKGKDGGGPSECDNAYHQNNDEEKVAALSTGWFNNMARCGHRIKISANGNSVYAKVVDECDSVHGCDDEHNFEPPCDNNIVDASPAVWDDLGLDQNRGMVDNWTLPGPRSERQLMTMPGPFVGTWHAYN
jgi:hypothetical protein